MIIRPHRGDATHAMFSVPIRRLYAIDRVGLVFLRLSVMCQREGKVCKLWVADCGGILRTRKTIEISVRERFPPRINYKFNKCYLYFICDGVCPSMNTKLTSIRPYVLPFCCSIFLFFFYHITVNKDEHITQILIKIEVK